MFRARVLCLVAAVALAGCQSAPRQPDEAGPASRSHSADLVVSIPAADVRAPGLSPVAPVPGGRALDRMGRTVSVADPRRVVSVASGAAETIAALGLASTVVGRDIASDGPSLHSVPVVTDAHAISVEKVLATQPTLVVVDDQTTPTAAVDAIERAGVQVIEVPQAWSLPAVAPRIRALAAALGVPARGTDLIARMTRAAAPVATNTASAPRVAFLYLRGTAAVYLLGGRGSGADSLIAAAGGIDVGAEARLRSFTPITPESMARIRPDVLLVMTKGLQSVGGLTGLRALPGVKQTPAAQHGRVIAVDDATLLSFGVDSYRLVGRLAAALRQVMHV
ncbi:MAG: ABC transporter substrate-binding protein [Actinomycetales bacterium]|nr:ABC transporter substrate-binding protein [Actinomycetales bacterium]